MRLASRSSRREPVKLGLALMGLFPVVRHRDLLFTLGRHEEFTLFAAVALANGEEDPVDDLWQLARNVTGWGRIHLVERSATVSPRVHAPTWWTGSCGKTSTTV
ncbi:hypothetical protein [Longispora fulva]|uniref:hypothetical protein n=1 Tax=Longispora fulva TaxID=619741 RepID=UPI00363BADF3